LHLNTNILILKILIVVDTGYWILDTHFPVY